MCSNNGTFPIVATVLKTVTLFPLLKVCSNNDPSWCGLPSSKKTQKPYRQTDKHRRLSPTPQRKECLALPSIAFVGCPRHLPRFGLYWQNIVDSVFRHSFRKIVLGIFIGGFIIISICYSHFLSNIFITLHSVPFGPAFLSFPLYSVLPSKSNIRTCQSQCIVVEFLKNITKYVFILKCSSKDCKFYCYTQKETLPHRRFFL